MDKCRPRLLSDHPNPGNREQAIEQEIRNWPPKQYVTNSAAFQKTKQHALTVKTYTGEEIAAGAKTGQWAALNKQNGAVFTGAPAPVNTAAHHDRQRDRVCSSSQSVLPSQRMVHAELGPMSLAHPDNWQVTMPRQQRDFVTIAPPAGVTQAGVGYGVLISSAAPPNGQRMSIDDITKALVAEMQQQNNLKPTGGHAVHLDRWSSRPFRRSAIHFAVRLRQRTAAGRERLAGHGSATRRLDHLFHLRRATG